MPDGIGIRWFRDAIDNPLVSHSLSDIWGLTGQKVFERLNSHNPAAASRFIFITGDVASEATRQYFVDNGIICLSKPFSIAELRQSVAFVLGSAGETPGTGKFEAA